MTHLLDTDHISIWERQSGTDFAALTANLVRHDDRNIGVSVVSYQEQAKGCDAYLGRTHKPADILKGYELLFRVIDAFRTFPLVPFDSSAQKEFDLIRNKRTRIGTMDLRIAAIALANNLTLVTRNTRDFELIERLRLEDWTQ